VIGEVHGAVEIEIEVLAAIVFVDALRQLEAAEFTGDRDIGRDIDAADGADAVVLVTEWEEFVALDWAQVAGRMAGKLVLDGRNALDVGAIRAAGLTYEGIGRGTLTQVY